MFLFTLQMITHFLQVNFVRHYHSLCKPECHKPYAKFHRAEIQYLKSEHKPHWIQNFTL